MPLDVTRNPEQGLEALQHANEQVNHCTSGFMHVLKHTISVLAAPFLSNVFSAAARLTLGSSLRARVSMTRSLGYLGSGLLRATHISAHVLYHSQQS